MASIIRRGTPPLEFRREVVAKMARAAGIRAQEYANAYDKGWRVVLGRRRGPAPAGSSPGFRTGQLRDAPFSRISGSGIRYRIRHAPKGNRVDVSRYLEFGTSRMRPRPFHQAVLDQAAPSFRRIGRQRLAG